MKNTKKNHQGNQIERSSRNAFPDILPIVRAIGGVRGPFTQFLPVQLVA